VPRVRREVFVVLVSTYFDPPLMQASVHARSGSFPWPVAALRCCAFTSMAREVEVWGACRTSDWDGIHPGKRHLSGVPTQSMRYTSPRVKPSVGAKAGGVGAGMSMAGGGAMNGDVGSTWLKARRS
jgi:hypothetical protein